MSVEASKSGESTPGTDTLEMAGETDEGFVQIESKKKPEKANSKKSKTETIKKAEIAAAIGDDDPLVTLTQPPKAEEFGEVIEDENKPEGGGWWGGLGGFVQAAKSTAAKVGSAAEAALNELTKEDEEEDEDGKEAKEEGEEGWENAGDAEMRAETKSEYIKCKRNLCTDFKGNCH